MKTVANTSGGDEVCLISTTVIDIVAITARRADIVRVRDTTTATTLLDGEMIDTDRQEVQVGTKMIVAGWVAEAGSAAKITVISTMRR